MSFDHKPTFAEVLCAQDLKEYGQALDELLEDLNYNTTVEAVHSTAQDTLGLVQKSMWDEDTKQVIVEQVREHVMGRLRETLGFAVEGEIMEIEAREGLSEEEGERLSRRVHHIEDDLTERLEKLRKKIA